MSEDTYGIWHWFRQTQEEEEPIGSHCPKCGLPYAIGIRCPKCNSKQVVVIYDDGKFFIQYGCEGCGNNWLIPKDYTNTNTRSSKSLESLENKGSSEIDWEEVLEHFVNKVFIFGDVEKHVGEKYGKLIYEDDWKRIVYGVNYNKSGKYEVINKRRMLLGRMYELYVTRERLLKG